MVITLSILLYITKLYPLRLNLRVISAVLLYTNCWKIIPSDFECEDDFSSLSQYNYALNAFLIVV